MNGFKQKGMVLLTTILLISLLALLTLSQMQLILLDYQALNLVKEKQKNFWAIEEVAAILAKDPDLLSKPCLLKEENPQLSLELLANKKGCNFHYKNQIFYYLIEDLGLNPCLQSKVNNKNHSTRHLNLSLRSEKQVDILQLRIAQLAKIKTCNETTAKQIKPGVLSWRLVKQ